jgi:hypothetical protein
MGDSPTDPLVEGLVVSGKAVIAGTINGNVTIRPERPIPSAAKRLGDQRSHSWGKVKDGRRAIWVAELEGDDLSDTHRTILVDSLLEHLHANVDILHAGIELKAGTSGNRSEDLTKAHLAAQALLEDHKGDLVVWGSILSIHGIALLRLHFSSIALSEAPTQYVVFSELVPKREIATALAAVSSALAITPNAFLRQLGEPTPPLSDLAASNWWDQATAVLFEVPKHVGWAASELGKNAEWLATGVLQNLGAAVAQASQLSGDAVGVIGGASGAALNEAAKAGWNLLSLNAQESTNTFSSSPDTP